LELMVFGFKCNNTTEAIKQEQEKMLSWKPCEMEITNRDLQKNMAIPVNSALSIKLTDIK